MKKLRLNYKNLELALFMLLFISFFSTEAFSQIDKIITGKGKKENTIDCRIINNDTKIITYVLNGETTPNIIPVNKVKKVVFDPPNVSDSTFQICDMFSFFSDNLKRQIVKYKSLFIWYGIDYTFTKLDFENITLKQYFSTNNYTEQFNKFVQTDEHFKNQLIINEYGNIFPGSIIQDLSGIKERNKKINVTSQYHATDGNGINLDTIRNVIKNLKSESKRGIGIITFVDYMSKVNELVIVHLVLFDIASRKILLYQCTSEKADGISFYWHFLNPVLQAINNINTELNIKKIYNLYCD
ncbi:MAG: hypothetical protein M0R21_01585 [Lentimicrobiaceae bacterium]|jgi:hypothetical protein|nr:hypothetical protein [Lentimicrobiaceae bacterium]